MEHVKAVEVNDASGQCVIVAGDRVLGNIRCGPNVHNACLLQIGAHHSPSTLTDTDIPTDDHVRHSLAYSNCIIHVSNKRVMIQSCTLMVLPKRIQS